MDLETTIISKATKAFFYWTNNPVSSFYQVYVGNPALLGREADERL